MTKKCGTCVSRRENKYKGCLECSLNIDKHLQLQESEECGSYEKGEPILSDYEFEYGNIHIDELNEMWLKGQEI